MDVGSGPVKSIKRYHSRLYVACGSDIVILKISDRQVEKRWTVIEKLVQQDDDLQYVMSLIYGDNIFWGTFMVTNLSNNYDELLR